jgi:hypothetical protein
VAAQILGNKVGICPTCTVVMVTSLVPRNKKVPEWQVYPQEQLIAQLIDVLDDIRSKGRKGKAALNMSFSWLKGAMSDPYLLSFRKQDPPPSRLFSLLLLLYLFPSSQPID